MLQAGSRLIAFDNSGAKKLKCIKVIGRTHKKYSFCLDSVLISVQKRNYRKKNKRCYVKKGDIFKAIVIRTVRKERHNTGAYIKFNENAAVLVNRADSKFVGNRFKGPVLRRFRTMSLKIGRVFSFTKKLV